MTGIYDSDTTKVMECSNCGLQFLDPLMTTEEEDEYYEGYYQNQRARQFKTMGLSDLQNQAYKHYEEYREIYLDLISNCESVLEIGSGTGGFLKFVSHYKPSIKLVAIERCSDNISYLRSSFGDRVDVHDSLGSVGGIRFDLIGAFGVFEHLRDSRKFFSDIRTNLTENGRLVMTVPNKAHALVCAYGLEEFKKFSYMKQHCFTFSERSFHFLAEQTSMSIEKFSYMQVWGLDNHLSWLQHRKPRDFSNTTSILSQETIQSYSRDLTDRKISDLMMVVLKAKNILAA